MYEQLIPFVIYNDKGKEIKSRDLRLRDPSFGTVVDGVASIRWAPEDENHDAYGFDKKNKEDNGHYTQEITLQKGTRIVRYGKPTGRFTADKGVCYNELSLPYEEASIEYHEYIVIADGLKVCCNVLKGKTAGMFGSTGGAVQYLHFQTILREMEDGKIKEDFQWLQNTRSSY